MRTVVRIGGLRRIYRSPATIQIVRDKRTEMNGHVRSVHLLIRRRGGWRCEGSTHHGPFGRPGMKRAGAELVFAAWMDRAGNQPRPMNGIVVAMMVRNCTLASSGSEAMYSTASAACRGSNTGST